MANVTGTLGGLSLQPFVIPFIQSPMESVADITTLDFTTYTDFIALKNKWELNWTRLYEDDYDDLTTVYTNQFLSGSYPTFVVPYYSIDTPVRMYINDKDVRRDGCYIMNVTVTLIQEAASISGVS